MHLAATRPRSDDGAAVGLSPLRLVIIAEHAIAARTLRGGLHRSGAFNLLGHAEPARASAQLITAVNPDVVLIDDMERADRALELIREIAAADERVQIVVLSSEVDDAWLSELFDAGATGAISKETHPRVIGMLLSETLKGHVFHRFSPAAPRRSVAVPLLGGHLPGAGEPLPLTGRELEVLRAVAAGSTNSDIARELCVAEQTVKFHLRNIFRKLGVANRTEASHIAHVRGLVGSAPAPMLAAAAG